MPSCMDIFILSDGKEIGPFSEETAQILIKQGTVAADDLAWASGMEDWTPLDKVLSLSRESAMPEQPREASEAPSSDAGAAAAEAKPEIEPATPKQKAFLGYLAIEIPEDLSKEQASTLLNDAMEDPACAEKIGKWSAERLRLHPELFAAEIHARKENRANHFFEICQTEGAQYFTRITKAHCQVLVGFLDAKFPSWDSRMADAATNYFFPAIAEKFPQLIERHWKDRFHYVQEPGAESARAPTARIKKRLMTPLVAVLRGIALGAVVLVILYFGQRMIPRWIGRHSAEKVEKAGSYISSPPSPAPPGDASAESPKAAEPTPAASPAPKKDEDKTAPEGEPAAPTSTPAPAKDAQGAAPESDAIPSSPPPSTTPPVKPPGEP
jgi:hypothetical protein